MNKTQNVFYVPKIKYTYKEASRCLSYFFRCNPLIFSTEADKNYRVFLYSVFILTGYNYW